MASTSKNIPDLDISFDDLAEADASEAEVPLLNENDPAEQLGSGEPTPALSTAPILLKGRNAPAWTDPDDSTLQVSLVSDNRLRKLRDVASEDTVGGREYESRLRRQFEKINPTPGWASSARKKLHPRKAKRRRSSASSGSSLGDEEENIHDLLYSTGGILGSVEKPGPLPQGTLAIERLRDANQAAQSEGGIKALQFHPSPQIPVLVTASADRRVRLFNVCTSSKLD